MSLIQTIETDLEAAGKWLEHEVEEAGTAVWGVVKTVFTSAEPAIVNAVVTAIKTFLPTISLEIASGTPLETLEQNFIQWAETESKDVLHSVETLGSTLVQALLALAIKAL